MGSVAQAVGDFVGDTVSSVGDIGQSVIDAGGDVIQSVGDGLTAATQGVSDAFEATGAAVLDVGEAVDRTVNEVIPGGWYTVAAVAITVASSGTINLQGEALAAAGAGEVAAASAAVGAGEVVAASAAAEAAAAGVAASQGVAAASATTAAAAAGNTAAQAALQAAASGALKGAAIGAAKSAITGGDIIDGALNGALTGAVGGGIGNYAGGLTAGTEFADYAKTIGAVAGGTAGGATSAALNDRDPLTGALIGGISGGTSSLASNVIPTDINPAITSGALGAAKAAVTGGDPLLGGLSAAGSSLVGQGVNAGYDAIKSGLDAVTPPVEQPTQVAEVAPPEPEEDYYKQFLAAFENPQLSDLPTYAPLAANDGSSVTVTQMNDSDGPGMPLVLQPTVDQLKEYLKQDVEKGLITQEQADAELNKAINSDSTIASSIDTLFYGDQAPKTLFNAPSSSTATTESQAPVTSNLPSTSNTGGTGTGNITVGDGVGSGTGGSGAGGTGTGGGSGGTGSGGGGGGGISSGGLGMGSMGYTTGSMPTYAQDAAAGLINLTPGLTRPMNYNLSGLPSIDETESPQNFATGGSTTSRSSLFDSKGNYNYGNLSDTPLTAALTKHNVGYTLTGLPSKAEGGVIEGHNPQFFSEGGALANRYVKGAGDGTSDSIPAMLANGEFVIPADIVSSLGNGSNDSGAKILDEFLRVVREHKKKHDGRRLPPDSKGPLSYLTDAKRKVRK
jgi:hypothetical protein